MEILERWQNVYRAAVQLCETVEKLPVECPCGDSDAHLSSRCRCCTGDALPRAAASHQTQPMGCDELIVRLRIELSLLFADFAQVLALDEPIVPPDARFEVKSGILLTARDLDQMLKALETVGQSVAGFKRDCVVTELQGVRRSSEALRAHCERLNHSLGFSD